MPLWPDDLESLALEQTGDALAQQHRVVGEDDADARRFALLLIWVLDVDAGQCRRKPIETRSPDQRSSEQRVDERSRELGLRNEAERGAAGDERAEIGAVEARGEDHLRRGASSSDSRSATSNPSKSGNCTSTIATSGLCAFASSTPLGAGSGFGHDDEAGPLEQLSRRSAEGAVVVDDENATIHRLIVPARAATAWCG